MSFEKRDDLYMTLEPTHVGNGVYRAKLPSSLFIGPYDKVLASLCDLSYITEDLTLFKNVEQAQLSIAIPKFTSNIELVDKATQTTKNVGDLGKDELFPGDENFEIINFSIHYCA